MSVSITSPQSKLITVTQQFPDIEWICSTEGQKYYEIQYRFKDHTPWSTCGKVESTDTSVSMQCIYDLVGVDFYEIYYRVIIYYDGYNIIGPVQGKDISNTYSVMFMHGIAGTLNVYDGAGTLKYNFYDQINTPTGSDKSKVEVLNIALDDDGTHIAKVPLVNKQSAIASNFTINIDNTYSLDQKVVAKEDAKFIANNIPAETNIYQTTYYYSTFYNYSEVEVYKYMPDYAYAPVYDAYENYNYGYYLSKYYNDKYHYTQPAGYTYYNKLNNYYTTYNTYAYKYVTYYTYYTEPAQSTYTYYNQITDYNTTGKYVSGGSTEYGWNPVREYYLYVSGYTINYYTNTNYAYKAYYAYSLGYSIYNASSSGTYYNNYLYSYSYTRQNTYYYYYYYLGRNYNVITYNTTYYGGREYGYILYSYSNKDSGTNYNKSSDTGTNYTTQYGYKYGGNYQYTGSGYSRYSYASDRPVGGPYNYVAYGYRRYTYTGYNAYFIKYSYSTVSSYYKYYYYTSYTYYYYITNYAYKSYRYYVQGSITYQTGSYYVNEYFKGGPAYSIQVYTDTGYAYGYIGFPYIYYSVYNRSYYYDYVSGYTSYISGYTTGYKDTSTNYGYKSHYVYYYYTYTINYNYYYYYNYVTGYHNEEKTYIHNYYVYKYKLNYNTVSYYNGLGYNIYYYYSLDAYYNSSPVDVYYYTPIPVYDLYTYNLNTYTSYIKYLYDYVSGYHPEYDFTYYFSYIDYYVINEYGYSYYS